MASFKFGTLIFSRCHFGSACSAEAISLLSKLRNTQVVVTVKARRHKSSRAGFSATSKELIVDLSSRQDAIRCPRPGESRPGIGRPLA